MALYTSALYIRQVAFHCTQARLTIMNFLATFVLLVVCSVQQLSEKNDNSHMADLVHTVDSVDHMAHMEVVHTVPMAPTALTVDSDEDP
ncbi:hypothetical protein V3C99_009360 [Haemonchus contortus]